MKCAVVHQIVHQSDVEYGMNFNPDFSPYIPPSQSPSIMSHMKQMSRTKIHKYISIGCPMLTSLSIGSDYSVYSLVASLLLTNEVSAALL